MFLEREYSKKNYYYLLLEILFLVITYTKKVTPVAANTPDKNDKT